MRWIVDGMNVIGSRPDGWWRDRTAARRRLVAELHELLGRPGMTTVEVVFDGEPGPDELRTEEEGGVHVSFAGGGADAADRAIVETVAASNRPEHVTVVTSDAALAAAVRTAGARVVAVSAFRRLLD